MLRVDIQTDSNGTTIIQIQGRLVREFAKDLLEHATHAALPTRTVVDLSDVTFVDEVGEEVLCWFKLVGAKFTADGVYTIDICRRLSLPMIARLSEAVSPSPGIGNVKHSEH